MAKKVLVLCIDRDDDFGKKANVKSPILGEEANLAAAQALAIKDPSESDVNAVYAAVNAYRELKHAGEDVEIATICGHRDRDHKSDKAVIDQLEKLIDKHNIGGVVLVSDGADDDQVLPLIQSRVKVMGVRTIIVKQAKELEKSYYVIKEVLRDPHFARLVFGLPGLALAIYGAVHLLGIQEISLNLVLALIGLYLILKGFGLEDAAVGAIAEFRKSTSIERASFPLYIGAVLVLLLSIWAGADNINFVWAAVPEGVIITHTYANVVNIAGFMLGAVGLFVLSSILFFAGRIGDMYYKGNFPLIRKYARSIVSMIGLYIITDAVGRFALYWTEATATGPTFADLFIAMGTAFMVTLAGSMVIRYFYVSRYVRPKLKKGLMVKSTDNEELGKITHIDYSLNIFNYTDDKEKKTTSFNQVLLVKEDTVTIG